MGNSTITLTNEEAETFADIRMRMLSLYGPYLWRDLLVAIVDDHLGAVCADAAPRMADDLPGWLLRQQRQTETAPLRGVMKDGKP